MSHKHAKAADKQEQFWSSINSQKLDTLRWAMLVRVLFLSLRAAGARRAPTLHLNSRYP